MTTLLKAAMDARARDFDAAPGKDVFRADPAAVKFKPAPLPRRRAPPPAPPPPAAPFDDFTPARLVALSLEVERLRAAEAARMAAEAEVRALRSQLVDWKVRAVDAEAQLAALTRNNRTP